MSFQTIAGTSDGVFWWFPSLSEDQEKKLSIHQNYLVALTVYNYIQYNSDYKPCNLYTKEVDALNVTSLSVAVFS